MSAYPLGSLACRAQAWSTGWAAMAQRTDGTRVRRAKRLALGFLPAAATTAALAGGVGPAAANTTTVQHHYIDGNGDDRTCDISLTRTYPFNDDSQVGEGGTEVTVDLTCAGGPVGPHAFIGASYNDPDGLAVTTEENADGASTFRRYAPIGDSFVTHHRVDFTVTSVGCIADCEFTASRSK
jgi:hypothetical protein